MPTTIKLGDAGDDVKRLQRVFVRAKVLGPDDLDGVFGPKTEQAVKDFQQSDGLVVDGVVGPITWSHIHPYREASPTLQAGSLGPVVAMLQGVLKTGFGYAGAIDGDFGPVTEAVVHQYQTNSGLPVTGVMDERDLDGTRRRRGRDAREPLWSDPLTAGPKFAAEPESARATSFSKASTTCHVCGPTGTLCLGFASSASSRANARMPRSSGYSTASRPRRRNRHRYRRHRGLPRRWDFPPAEAIPGSKQVPNAVVAREPASQPSTANSESRRVERPAPTPGNAARAEIEPPKA